ncbi:glycerophosphodiester phosphodiesterase [Alishewanella tabrizica]|uniref:Glycerophosphoryl diester phosphodiesterase n=1 Tax=Alishewanella tabrizica TaxID=671278 RepID=A0ABQ2WNY3_9ALTE|nr:glycerophosphodiester phosphodiesterase family protein [Alishewanella tabrizica]GGW64539.1 glycerophosphoryl diester phosphodiesterase [Alishewanella tabrizica]
MQIIAHRGASGEFPENTLLAFQQAIAQGADAIELDVFAVENELVVIHDARLERTTSGQGSLYAHSLAQLAQLDAGQGQSIPLLWQVLQLIQGKCWLNIELKGHDTLTPLLSLLDRAVNELNVDLSTLLISSFNHPLLAALKQAKPSIRIGALTANLPLDYAKFASELQAEAVHCDVDFINEDMVKDAKARGLKVYVYTVDGEQAVNAMHLLGVDGIFTNYPAKSRAILNSKD